MSTITVQVFPSGRVYLVDEVARLLKPSEGEWSSGTPEQWREIAIQQRAESYLRNEVYCCQSALIDDLIRAEQDSFTVDDLEGMYRNFDGATLGECRDYLHDMGSSNFPDPDPWEMTREALIEALAEVGIECREEERTEDLREAVIANIDDETIDGLSEWRDAANEVARDNPQEAYEWWAVSPWLCRQLRDRGEIVIDSGYGQWWGRGCTGQGVIMDGTLQAIAAGFVS